MRYSNLAEGYHCYVREKVSESLIFVEPFFTVTKYNLAITQQMIVAKPFLVCYKQV